MKNKKFTSAIAFTISLTLTAVFAVGAVFLGLLGNTPTYAAPPVVLTSDVMLPLVAVEDNQLKLFGFNAGPQVIDDNVNPFASNQVWSPDGNRLAYLSMGDDGTNRLMLTDSLGSAPQAIANMNTNLFSFSQDNTQLHYAVIPNTAEATSIGDNFTLDVMSYTIGSTSPSQKIGSFQQASCGGGGPSAYDALYWMEAGQGGMRPIFSVVEAGILYSNSCSGMGLSLVKPGTGEATLLDSDIINVRLSANGQQAIGIKNGQLMLIEIASGETATIGTDATPEHVIWGADGTGDIYYSIRNTTDDVVAYDADEQQKLLNLVGIEVSEVTINQVAIHRLNLETGLEEVVYENTAYAIGYMTRLPDNRLLMVSEIPSLATWFDAVLASDGSTPVNLETELYLVSLEDAEMRLLGTGLLGARLNDAAYVRQFGISPQVTAQPATVGIGTQVNLLGSNFPAQSRVSVYMGKTANALDDAPYASGLTRVDGSITLSFNLPATFEDGRALSNGELVFVVETSDGLFSAETRVTVNTNTPKPTINTGLPTPVQSAVVSISPDNGTVGTQININGRNFPANRRVNVHLGNVVAGASNATYASAFSDNNGNISLTFEVPGVFADGSVIQANQLVVVVATDDFSTSAALTFNFTPVTQAVVLPTLSLSPTSMKIDERLTVRGRNFPANATVTIFLGPSANDLRGNYRTVTTDSGGGVDASFKLPERWRDGQKVNSAQVAVVAIHAPTNSSASAILALIPTGRDGRKPTTGTGDAPPPVDTGDTGTGDTGTGDTGTGDSDTGDSETGDTDTGETETGDTEDGDPETGDTEDGDTETGDTEDGDTETGDTEDGDTETGDTEDGDTETGDTEDGDPETGDTQEPVVIVTGQSVSVLPDNAGINGTVTVSGEGFTAGSVINFQLVGEGGIITNSVFTTADESGMFSTPFEVPAMSADMQPLPAGPYLLIASGAGTEESAQIEFTVTE